MKLPDAVPSTGGRHRAPTERTAQALLAKWLPPVAASIATHALRIAVNTVLGVLAFLVGAVLTLQATTEVPTKPGTTLQTPAQQPSDERHITVPKPSTEPAKPPAPAPKTVRLRPGDTLWALAQHHHTTVAVLQRANGLGTSTMIYAGHRLFLIPPATPLRPPA
ncbi:LysM peptidoglycan-binding domain-containing protein [Streptomyces sp. T-3]|nr:LysM peptidoglycan-binding domain-containing protein [Streptomyces sp. T-3]